MRHRGLLATQRPAAIRAAFSGLLLVLVAAAGCGGPPSPADGAGAASRPRVWRPGTPDTTGPVLAIVGSTRITRHQVDSLLATAPSGVQQQYRSAPDQYRQLVERVADNEVIHQAAMRDSIEKDPEYRAELAGRAFELRLKHFYRRYHDRFPQPADSAIEAWYAEHAKDFDIPGRAKVRHILYTTEDRAKAGRRRIQRGAPWDSVCARESKDALTKRNGGLIGFVASDGELVPGIGRAPAIAAAAFELKQGEVSQPLRSEKGWHLITVDEVHAASRQPLAQVRDRIAAQLKGEIDEEYGKAFIDSLRKAAGVTIFHDSIAFAIQPAKTPQELFEQAQAAAIPRDRVALYRQLIAKFPNDRVSEQAAFMVGFTYAEEMQDFASARTAFEEFKRKYPQSDLVKSAQWMLDNMEKSDPPFEEDAPGEGTEQGDGGE